MNKEQITYLSIVLISLPSLPLFLILKIVGKALGKSQNFEDSSAIELMLAFAMGSILGDVFLHIMPHLFGDNNFWELFLIVFVILFALDLIMDWKSAGKKKNKKKSKGHSHNHSHEENKKDNYSAFLYLTADFLHNFVDGIAIATAYSVSRFLET